MTGEVIALLLDAELPLETGEVEALLLEAELALEWVDE